MGFIRAPQRKPRHQPDPQPLATLRDSPPEQDATRLPSQELPETPNEDGWDDEESDDEDDNLDDTFGSSSPGWEPPVLNDADNMSISSDTADSDLPATPPPEDLRRRTWVTPKVVKFPNPHAGEPTHSVDSTNNTYATLLGQGSDLNPYNPFTSKIDWEVAKWAKLQGPSSTSLAELLKIEGVILFCPNG